MKTVTSCPSAVTFVQHRHMELYNNYMYVCKLWITQTDLLSTKIGGGGGERLINSPLFVHHLGLPAQAHEFICYLWVSHCLTKNKTDSESNGKHKN